MRITLFLTAMLTPALLHAQDPTPATPLITNDAIILGLLICFLALVFYTSNLNSPFWKRFYTFFPSLLLCYFLPSLLNTTGIVDPAQSKLYFVASRYFLPASLVLFTLSMDFKALMRLGPKSLLMFLFGTLGIMLGALVAFVSMQAISPETVQDETWRGLSTIAGSWIGGGANQAALKEVFHVEENLFSQMITVDVLIANFWMALLLYGVGITAKLDRWFKADQSLMEQLKSQMALQAGNAPQALDTTKILLILAAAMGVSGLAHLAADFLAPFFQTHFPSTAKFSFTEPFFWVVVLATTGGMLLSLTRARKLETYGASRFGSVFLYLLVAVIGMKMDIRAIFDSPMLFLLGLIWISVHAILLIIAAKLLKAPFFMLAVGSQANVGGTASASIVASAFHPSLAPIGVLLAVLGYILGTYGGYLTGLMLQALAQPGQHL